MSQGQATRSTFTFSRVIQFIVNLLFSSKNKAKLSHREKEKARGPGRAPQPFCRHSSQRHFFFFWRTPATYKPTPARKAIPYPFCSYVMLTYRWPFFSKVRNQVALVKMRTILAITATTPMRAITLPARSEEHTSELQSTTQS